VLFLLRLFCSLGSIGSGVRLAEEDRFFVAISVAKFLFENLPSHSPFLPIAPPPGGHGGLTVLSFPLCHQGECASFDGDFSAFSPHGTPPLIPPDF